MTTRSSALECPLVNGVEYRPKGQGSRSGSSDTARRCRFQATWLLPSLPASAFFLSVLMASEVTQKIAEHRVAYHAVLALLEA